MSHPFRLVSTTPIDPSAASLRRRAIATTHLGREIQGIFRFGPPRQTNQVLTCRSAEDLATAPYPR